MTIKETAKQLCKLSGGHINGERYTLTQLKEVLSMWMRNTDTYVGRIALPDGEWFFLISRFPHNDNQFDYFIPDTREREKDLVKRFLGIEI